eukprot:Skav222321  [mRNA]  locus=scaffold1249:248094:249462:+ [translate_table: standard]
MELFRKGKLCRLIFAEEIPSEEVDEKFLDLLQRAENYEGTHSPRRPAPVLCLVAPPFQVDVQLATALQALLQARGQMNSMNAHPGTCDATRFAWSELHRENLASAWHASTASKAKAFLFGQVYLNQIPVHIEGLFVPQSDTEPVQKRRRVEMEERRNQSNSQLANSLGQRCLFVFWGWSSRLQINHGWKHQSPTDQRLLRSKGMRSAAGVFFQKLQAQALHLRGKLPSAQTLWLSGLPSLSDRRAMSTIAASIEQAWANTEIPNPKELQWQTSRATVIAILPMALPGMGKISLLEALFRRCQSGGSKCYRQGKLLTSSPGANSGSLPRPAAAAIVSSRLACSLGLREIPC